MISRAKESQCKTLTSRDWERGSGVFLAVIKPYTLPTAGNSRGLSLPISALSRGDLPFRDDHMFADLLYVLVS